MNQLGGSQRKVSFQSNNYNTKIIWKKTWSVIKDIMAKMHQHKKSKLFCKLFVDKKHITLETKIANKLDAFFTDTSPYLARKILTPSKPFKRFFKKASASFLKRWVTINELNETFLSLKMGKRTGVNEIFFNVVKTSFGASNDILKYVFDLVFQTGIFPDPLKIEKVTLHVSRKY